MLVDVYVRTPGGYYGVNVSVNSPSLGARRLSHGETHVVGGVAEDGLTRGVLVLENKGGTLL